MTDFVMFTKDQFEESFLKKYGYIDQTKLVVLDKSKEYVYHYSLPKVDKVGIYIFSSVSICEDQSREKGSDAIRSILFDSISGKAVGKETRTHRTIGWQKRLNLKIENLSKLISDLNYCPKCGSVMVKRNGQYGEFWGCLSYPKCNGKPKEITTEDIRRDIFLKMITDQIIDFNSITVVAKMNEKQAFQQLIKRNNQLINKFRFELRKGEEQKESIKKIIGLKFQQSLLKTLTEEQRTIFWEKLGHGWVTIDPILIDQALGSAKIKNEIKLIEPEPTNLPAIMEYSLGSEEKFPLVPTKEFQYIDFPFDLFNPPQSEAVQYIDQDCNLVVASPTASGKTVIAEMTIAKTLLNSDETKAVYLAPMKALAEEKLSDFTDQNHPFSGLKITAMTGDYEMTEKKKREVKEASIILMTNEMLAVRCRMSESEKSEWIKDIKCLIVDEAHLLGIKGRGDNTEAALMMFTKINSECRIIFLSATMPNVSELGKWIYSLNQKPTKTIQSNYRPCKIEKHYIEIPPTEKYQQDQFERMKRTAELINQHPQDTWLVFSGTKTWGRQALNYLRENTNLSVEFINADLKREEKQQLVRDFENGKINILIATTVLAYGVNLPARRVIVAHQSFGIEEMPTCDILQMIGRSGRPKYDKQGDAYILVKQSGMKLWKKRIEEGENIKSLFGQKDVLEFHAIAEIENGNIQTKLDFYNWYSRSLAAIQDIVPASPDEVLDNLQIMGCISYDKGYIKSTMLGKIATWMYHPPRVVSQWRQNVENWWGDSKDRIKTFQLYDKTYRLSDAAMSLILNYNIDQEGYIPRNEKELVNQFYTSILNFNYRGDVVLSPTLRNTVATLFQMNGREEKTGLGALQRQIAYDSGRNCNTVKLIAEKVCKVDLKNELISAELRIRYGVGEDLISLVQVKGIGSVRAKRLFDSEIKNAEELIDPKNRGKVLEILGKKNGEQILGDAENDL